MPSGKVTMAGLAWVITSAVPIGSHRIFTGKMVSPIKASLVKRLRAVVWSNIRVMPA
jgi:hypothetical protein